MALLILNTKINLSLPVFAKYWDSATIKICADGGATRLEIYNVKHSTNYIPDLIIGDMDSYSGNNKEILKINDQDTTDFTKCIQYLEGRNISDILVIGGYGGRMDHVFANYDTIIKSNSKIVMIDRDNYSCKINLGSNTFECNGYCGLIPLTKSKVKTEGFEWNVDGEMGFNILISTSNRAVGRVNISLEYGDCVFWKSNL
jgi:thiamine pyrophosphokinase